MSAAAIAVIAVVIGLLVWAPWEPPAPPTGLAVKATTSTTVTLSWEPKSKGTHVGRYAVLRGGDEVGSVNGSQTDFVDTGLKPGGSYGYQVVAMDGSQRSEPSLTAVKAVTAAPSPFGVRKVVATPESVTVAWVAPAESPTPDRYLVLVDGHQVDAVAGGSPSDTLSCQVKNLRFGTSYSLQVRAEWRGGGTSPPSSALRVTTPNPPLSQARFETTESQVAFKITSSNIKNLSVGSTFTNTWSFTSECSTGPCNVRLTGNFFGRPNPASFEVVLTRHGATYSGQTVAEISKCRGSWVKDKVKVTLTVTAASGQDWTVSRWSGTIESRNPYTNAGSYYCPAGTTKAVLYSSASPGV